MYELRVQRVFSAAHALVIAGEREPLHGHDWHVTLAVRGPRLDGDGLLCDFHELEQRLDRIVGALHNRTLNETPPFDALNPTAEHVARHIGEAMRPAVPDGATIARVEVTEAPGCTAVWHGDG